MPDVARLRACFVVLGLSKIVQKITLMAQRSKLAASLALQGCGQYRKVQSIKVHQGKCRPSASPRFAN
jgi:hypothetical protein